ncbi:hypothetical protein GN956_G26178 [Arapaima gigas]
MRTTSPETVWRAAWTACSKPWLTIVFSQTLAPFYRQLQSSKQQLSLPAAMPEKPDPKIKQICTENEPTGWCYA